MGDNANFLHRIRDRERKVGRPDSTVKTSYFTPSLVEICARAVAADFAQQPPLAEDLDESLRQLVISHLSTELSVFVTVPRVEDEGYWRTCCLARWTPGQLGRSKEDAQNSSKWKQLYLERNLAEFFEHLDEELPTGPQSKVELPKLCKLSAEWVGSLKIGRLKCHVDLAEVSLWLPKLHTLQVTYGAMDSGMNYDYRMFGIRQQDCTHLAEAVRNTTTLTTLALPENQIDNDKLKAIIAGLVRNGGSLTKLDLSHNRIGDPGVRALATLLVKKGQSIKEVDLMDNCIREDGAKGLGKALTMNTSLTSLTLRLNRVGDEGGRGLLDCLKENSTLVSLNLSHNDLGMESVNSLCEVLRGPKCSLTVLELNGNMGMGEEAGKALLEAVEANSSLRTIDVRSSGLKEEERCLIQDTTNQRNRK